MHLLHRWGLLLTALDIGISRSNSMPLGMRMCIPSHSKPVLLDVSADRNLNDHAGYTGSDREPYHNPGPMCVDTPSHY